MSSTFTLELDTTPPEVVWGDPVRLSGGEVRVPYTMSESGVLDVSISSVDAIVSPTEVTSDGPAPSGPSVELDWTATDIFGNPISQVSNLLIGFTIWDQALAGDTEESHMGLVDTHRGSPQDTEPSPPGITERGSTDVH